MLRNVLEPLPVSLKSKAAQAYQAFVNAARDLDVGCVSQDACLYLFGVSDFAAKLAVSEPAIIIQAFQALDKPVDKKSLCALTQTMAQVEDITQLQKAIRLFRHQMLVRILWRLTLGLTQLDEHLKELSRLADSLIRHTHDWLFEDLAKLYGYPEVDGQKQPLVIVAMGKLGGGELNFSSDIDLIYCYPTQGETQGGKKSIPFEKFYQLLAQQFTDSLSKVTPEGFVYRIDLRLRPYGSAGPMVLSFNGLENYYQVHGRDWERYAWVKARPITGQPAQKKEVLGLLEPFVYRRYLDFSAFGSLRDMKQKVQTQARKQKLKANLKLGLGGIRQIEFIAQMFQLIRAGKEPQFKTRSLSTALKRLANAKIIKTSTWKKLTDAYAFLRLSEHWLQIHNDEQTHDLPTCPIMQARLSWGMGFSNYEAYLQTLNQHRAWVQSQFDRLSTPLPQGLNQDSKHGQLFERIWQESHDKEMHQEFSHLLEVPVSFFESLDRFRQSKQVKGLRTTARSRLDDFMPRLLSYMFDYSNPQALLNSLLKIIRNITRRSSYLLLLNENPKALNRLVLLCSKSPWVVSQMADFPVLIDELLSPIPKTYEIDKALMVKQLDDSLKWVADDLDGQMEKLRLFKLSLTLKFAMIELSSSEGINIGLALTTLAEVILEKTYEISCEQIKAKYQDFSCDDVKLGIIAYGNFGARELHYSSDLDLVFIYEDNGNNLQEYYLRLAQRMIHILSTHTLSGKLYEIDVRLRPGGSSGMLVTSLNAYAKYVEQAAWTFEHQALVRARLLLGHPRLTQVFAAIRANVLTQRRPPDELSHEIANMREKMRQTLNPIKGFHLKQSRGGLTDIEFMVQYYVLSHARDFPVLLTLTSTKDLLMALRELKVISPRCFEDLMGATVFYQSQIRLRILAQSEQAVTSEALPWAQRVLIHWQAIFGDNL